MSSFRDDPMKDLGFVVFPASAGLDQRDCRFHAFPLYLWKFTKTNSFMLTGLIFGYILLKRTCNQG